MNVLCRGDNENNENNKLTKTTKPAEIAGFILEKRFTLSEVEGHIKK